MKKGSLCPHIKTSRSSRPKFRPRLPDVDIIPLFPLHYSYTLISSFLMPIQHFFSPTDRVILYTPTITYLKKYGATQPKQTCKCTAILSLVHCIEPRKVSLWKWSHIDKRCGQTPKNMTVAVAISRACQGLPTTRDKNPGRCKYCLSAI